MPPYSPELNRIESLWHRIKSLVGGTATIFRGDMRISTNVKKDDGSRAVSAMEPLPLLGSI